MNKLFDLRFAIGLFFLIIGLLLVSYYLFSSGLKASKVNAYCGSVFIVFGISMILLTFRESKSE